MQVFNWRLATRRKNTHTLEAQNTSQNSTLKIMESRLTKNSMTRRHHAYTPQV